MHVQSNHPKQYRPSTYSKHIGCRTFYPAVWISLLLVSAILWCIGGCSKDSNQTAQVQDSLATGGATTAALPGNPRLWEDPKYRDWTSTTFGMVKLYFPVTHQHADEMPEMAQGYQHAITTVAQRLERPEPLDTVRVYMYTGPGQGEAMTGRDIPFYDAAGIHYWPSYLRGESLVKYLLPRMYGTNTKYPIMTQGLSALFDFAGEDYHRVAAGYMKDTMFVPLSKLAMDSTMNSAFERHQSGEAASFLAFVLGEYGPGAIAALYQSTVSFDSAVTRIFGISTDSLQQQWKSYVRALVPDTAQPQP